MAVRMNAMALYMESVGAMKRTGIADAKMVGRGLTAIWLVKPNVLIGQTMIMVK